MKKKFYLFALAFLGLTLASCGTGSVGLNYDESDLDIDTPWVDYSVPVTAVNFESGQDEITINVPDTYEYQYSIEPAKAKKSSLNWASTDENVATVNKGVVTAVGAGTASITVSNDQMSFNPITLVVHVNIPVTDISFDSQSMDVDYNHQYQLSVNYTPSNTNQTEVTWSSSNEDLATVTQNGLVTTKGNDGTVVISANSAFINKQISISLNVADRAIYPQSVEFADPIPTKIEVGHNVTFSARVHREDAQTVTDPTVKYHTDDQTGTIEVEEDTGVVHALNVGSGTSSIYATAKGPRGGVVRSESITFTIFEVKVTQINITDFVLSNRNGRTEVPVDFTYDTDTVDHPVASIPNFVYESSDESVFTVNDNGKMYAVAESGQAYLTVRDTRSGVSARVNVFVRYEVDSVSISGASQMNVGATTQLNVTTVPAGVPASYITYTTSDPSIATVSETGLVTANAEGTVTITATVLGESASIEITALIPDIPFDSSKVYVVGSSKYVTGVSQDSPTGGSWDKANQARVVDEPTQNHDALWEKRTIITFRAGDIWKLRTANNYYPVDGWIEGYPYQRGEYKIYEGAFSGSSPDMSVSDDDYKNVIVNRAGTYAIYFALYANDHDEGWYSVYVERNELTITDTTPQVQINTSVVIEAHNWTGELTQEVISGNDLITVTRSVTEIWKFTITAGANTGTATIRFADERTTVDVVVEVTEDAPLPKTFDDGWPYVVGNSDYHSGTAEGSGSYWGDDASKAFRALASSETPPEGVFAQYEAEITFSAGNLFKVVVGGSTLYWDATYQDTEGAFATTPAQMTHQSDGNKNIVVNEAGTYKLYIKCLENDGGWQVYIAPKSGTEPVQDAEYYLKGDFNSWAASNEYKFAKISDNQYQLTGVEIQAGEAMRAFRPNPEAWYGVNEAYEDCGWTVGENGNCVVTAGGIYTVNLYLEALKDNHLTIEKTGDIPDVPPEPGEFDDTKVTPITVIDQTNKGFTYYGCDVKLHIFDITFAENSPITTIAGLEAADVDYGEAAVTYSESAIDLTMTWVQNDPVKYTVTLPAYIESCKVCVYNTDGNWVTEVNPNTQVVDSNSYQFPTARNNSYDLYLFNNYDPSYDAWVDTDNHRFVSPLSLVPTPIV